MDPTSFFAGTAAFDLSPSSHEEDYDDLGALSDGEDVEQMDSAAGPKRKPRRLPSTAEKRANHNAIERARRESLNGRFMELASALPTMAVIKRPSKNAIVLKSLEFVKGARAREQALEGENARLRSEVNELRAKLGMSLIETSVPTTVVSQAPVISAAKQDAHISRSPPMVTAKPVIGLPKTVSRSNSISQLPVSTAGPYLAQDPLAVPSFYGFVDPFQVKVEAASPQSSTSDSDASLVTTPTDVHSFAASPTFFFGETVHAPSTGTSSFDDDLLAHCGMPSTFPTMPVWPSSSAAAPGISYGAPPIASGFPPLFA